MKKDLKKPLKKKKVIKKEKLSKKETYKKDSSKIEGKKLSSKFIIFFLIIFIIIQVIGFLTFSYYSSFEDLRITLITDDPNDIVNALFIIGQILLITGIILLIKRFSKRTGYLKFFEYIALFFGMVIVFDVFLLYVIGLYLAVLLLFTKYLLEKNAPEYKKTIMWYNNIFLGIAIAGAGAIIGLSLGIIPVIVFIILLSIYDIIAVFYTKHMIDLAKTFSKTKMALIFYIPSKERVYQLGAGDIVIPLVVSSSLYFYLLNLLPLNIIILVLILLWISSLIGLFLTFYILKVRNLKAMPALPLQALFMVIVIVLTITFLI